MPEMRHPTLWSNGSAQRGTIARIVWSSVVLVAIVVPAAAASIATTEPTMPAAAAAIATTEPTMPAAIRTVDRPAGSPFDEVVGGTLLGNPGMTVVPVGVAPPQSVDATAWLVADIGSGNVLGGFNTHEGRLPASTIKLLTALALLPNIDADATYTATDADIIVDGSRVGIVPGQQYTRAALAHGLLLASGNDAANALAQLAGGTARALSLMSDEAKRLGAFDTTVQTTHGLDEPGQLTSAYDLALIGRAVLLNQELAPVVRTQIYDFPGLEGQTFQIQNRNRLLDSYPGAIGLKNGFTTLAGHTLVAAAERDGVQLVAVVLGGRGRPESTARALLDWGFALAPGAEPVGWLVTPAEVAEARREQEQRTTSASPVLERDPRSSGQGGAEPVASNATSDWPMTAAVIVVVVLAVTGAAIIARRRQQSSASVVGPVE